MGAEGCENCDRMDDTSVAKKIICHTPVTKTFRTAKTDTTDKKSL